MVLLVDIGNTNIVVAVAEKNEFITKFRLFTDDKKTSDEYSVILKSLIKEKIRDFSEIKSAVISSVVPNLTLSFQKVVYSLFSIEPLMVSHDVKTGLVRSTIPSELGYDLLCNLAYAHHTHPEENVMVVDFGTALTFSTVDKEGKVLGVSIAPGLITAVNSLFGATAQLPQVELKIPSSVLGRDSQCSIRSGIMIGFSGLVEKIISETEKEISQPLFVIATGGLSKTMKAAISRIDSLDPEHTLRGLKLIADLNC